MYNFAMSFMDTEYLQTQIRDISGSGISEGVFSGCVVGVLFPDGRDQVFSFGDDGCGLPMHPDRVFDIASVTKSIPVGTLALKWILEGILDPQMPIYEILAEYRNNYRMDVKVWHLLTHSLDYRFPMSSLKELPPSAIWERLMTHSFQEAPGTSFSYGNAASVILGVLLERISGKDLETLAQDSFFAPLGMNATGWNPLSRHPCGQIVPTELCSWRNRQIRGEVHDESAFAMGRPVGSAGVFSTVPDLLRFLAMLQKDGVSREGVRVTAPGLSQMLACNALAHLSGQGTALGWELNNRRFMGEVASVRTFGKTGFTGASVVFDPDRQLGVILLTNFTWPQREPTVERIYAIRRRLHDALFRMVPASGG